MPTPIHIFGIYRPVFGYFTDRLSRKFAVKLSLRIPRHITGHEWTSDAKRLEQTI